MDCKSTRGVSAPAGEGGSRQPALPRQQRSGRPLVRRGRPRALVHAQETQVLAEKERLVPVRLPAPPRREEAPSTPISRHSTQRLSLPRQQRKRRRQLAPPLRQRFELRRWHCQQHPDGMGSAEVGQALFQEPHAQPHHKRQDHEAGQQPCTQVMTPQIEGKAAANPQHEGEHRTDQHLTLRQCVEVATPPDGARQRRLRAGRRAAAWMRRQEALLEDAPLLQQAEQQDGRPRHEPRQREHQQHHAQQRTAQDDRQGAAAAGPSAGQDLRV
mmetsp:Transcript_146958/g.356759  ORF Transcript_146958/g.356759 Transcript_146958/m.356759 type:complete len:271 (+) Transcript_146958:1-813(+)